MLWLTYLLAVATCLCVTSASRILAIVPSPSYSHQVAFRQIWRALSLNGHQVTLMTTDPLNDTKLTNLTEIDLHYSYEVMADISTVLQKTNPITILQYFLKKTSEITNQQLSDEKVNELIQNKGLYDLVIVEAFFPEFLAFAELYNCPKILISSMEVPSIIHIYMGNPSNPVVYPEYTLPFSEDLSFVERIISSIYYLFIVSHRKYIVFPEKHRIIKKYFGDSVASVSDLINDVDMLFLNVNPIMNDIRPHGPATITFGGINHMAPEQPLPKDLKQFLDGATSGFIFLSLGSNMKSKNLDQQKIDTILEVLKEIPFKILWKFELDDLPGKTDNIKLIKWAPQQDILKHPNIKLFITQGGIQSIEESIMSHVPMVVLPFFGDQEKNARKIVGSGIAKSVFHKPVLVKEEFKEAILEVIQNTKYKEKVREVHHLIIDQPMNGVEKVLWWTEYVIRNNGAKHLKSPLADVPLYQYIFLDVAAFFVLLMAATSVVVVKSLKLMKTFLCKIKTRVSTDKKIR